MGTAPFLPAQEQDKLLLVILAGTILLLRGEGDTTGWGTRDTQGYLQRSFSHKSHVCIFSLKSGVFKRLLLLFMEGDKAEFSIRRAPVKQKFLHWEHSSKSKQTFLTQFQVWRWNSSLGAKSQTPAPRGREKPQERKFTLQPQTLWDTEWSKN